MLAALMLGVESLFALGMSITIKFACRSTHTERSRAALNVCALMSELPVAHLVLLDSLCVEIEFGRRSSSDSAVHGANQSINLDLNDFGRFTYRRGRKRTASHRHALARLTQQSIHVLDSHVRFTSRRDWKKAAKAERQMPNTRMHELAAAERQDACCDETQREPHGYRFILEKLTALFDPAVAPARRLLVDLLMVREHLLRSTVSRSEVDQMMQEAFPNTYAVALQFDSLVKRAAVQSVIRRHPEMAPEPVLTMQLALQDLEVIWHPLDASIDIEKGARRRGRR